MVLSRASLDLWWWSKGVSSHPLEWDERRKGAGRAARQGAHCDEAWVWPSGVVGQVAADDTYIFMSRTAYHHHHHRQPEYHRVGGTSTIRPTPSLAVLSLSFLLSVSFATPYTPRGRPGRQAGRVPLAFARSGLLIRPRRCASRARAVFTLPLKSATRMPRETKAWGFPPRGKWNASGRLLPPLAFASPTAGTNVATSIPWLPNFHHVADKKLLRCSSAFHASSTLVDLSKEHFRFMIPVIICSYFIYFFSYYRNFFLWFWKVIDPRN